MPTPQVVALLQAMPTATAVGVLVAMPDDHIEVLLAELPTSELARLVPAADREHRAELFAATPDDRLPDLLRSLPLATAADLLGGLPAEQATRLLGTLPTEARSQLVSALPEAVRHSVYAAMSSAPARELATAVYERHALAALARIAAVRSRPSVREAVADVLGSQLLVHARSAGTGQLDAEELHQLVLDSDWATLDGMLILSEAVPTERAAAYVAAVRSAGYRLELLRWADARDDGLLKRALVRLAAPTPAPA